MVLCLSMIIVLKRKITPGELKQVSQDLEGYVKFVVDVEKKIVAAGGTRHVDGEQELLKTDSRQQDLWGGGWDLETDEVDFDSMINIRPHQGNLSREVLSPDLRQKIISIIDKLLKVN